MLAACSGGGGSAGVPGGSSSPQNFLVNAPKELTLAVGTPAVFPITGGKTPYVVSSTAPNIALGFIENGNLVVSALRVGGASIRVAPSGGGAEFVMSVSVVTNVSPLVVQSPDVVTIGVGNNVSYTLLGGVPPYKTVSTDNTILAAEVIGSQLRLSGVKKGSVAVQVYDSDPTNLTPVSKLVNVVDAVPLTTSAPASGLTIARGATRTFTISGGVAPYFAETNDTTVLDATVSAANLSLSGVGSGSAVVTLRDSAGNVITIAASVVIPQPFFTTAPAAGLVLDINTFRDFDVGGGVSPYATPVSTNTAVATVTLTGGVMRITGRSSGSATISLRDAAGATLNIAVSVSSLSPFFTTAPGTGLTMGTGSTRDFEVGGGVLPYAVPVSTNASVATAAINGTELRVTAHAVGSASITLRDASGASLSFAVTVNSSSAPFFTTAPSTGLIFAIATPRDFDLGGGTLPYATPVSTNAAVATASISGSTLRITGHAVGTSTISLRDAAGATLGIAVTVSNLTPLSTTAPAAGLVLGVGVSRPFEVSGGTPAYATPVSSNTAVATATLTGGDLTITGRALGSATITLRDAAGASLSIPVTVSTSSPFFTTAPTAGLFVGLGAYDEFDVGGGVTPYLSPVSANSAVATAQYVGGRLRITGVAAGTTAITLRDTAGTSLSVAVTVGTVVPFATNAPSTGLIVSTSTPRDFVVTGGVMPYVLPVSSNAAVATASLVNNDLRITGLLPGTATITLRDGAGTTLNIGVTVSTASPFFTTAPSAGLVLAVGGFQTFDVGGGMPPYALQPVSTNTAVATATLNGPTLTINGHSTGTAGITLRDSAGATLSIAVTVGAADALSTTAPTTLTIDGDTARSFEVRGGTGYSAQSSNNAVVIASIPATPGADTRSLLTLTAVGNGTATVLVTDSRGRSLTLNVTVVNGSGTGVVSSVDLTTSTLSLLSASGDAVITAFVKNAANVAMPNIPVQFSADSGTLLSVDATTNASGVAVARLSPGSNRANREITVRAAAGAQSGTVRVAVTGSTLTITGSSTQQLAATASYSVRAVDSSGNAMPGLVLSVTSALGNSVSPATVTTDMAGNASFSYTASNSGSDTLTVTGPGTMRQTLSVTISAVSLSFATPAANTSVNVGASQAVTVRYLVGGVAVPGTSVTFSSTRGTVSSPVQTTNGSGDATVNISSTTAGPATITAQIAGVGNATLPVNFVATTPATITLQGTPSAIAPNQPGSTANQTTLSAVVRDSSGNLVANQTVNFNLVSDLSGGSLSAGTAVTDANGRAQVQFIAGASSTPNNGVQVSATVTGITATANLTVSGSALFISFGISNEIGNLDPTIYSKRYAVYVTDANGVAVGNQVVNLSVIPTQYGKGTLSWYNVPGIWAYSAGSPTECANEDANRNGILNTGEDFNGNGRLTPGNVAVASPGILTTDASGRAFFDLQYGEQYVPWVDVMLTARASVSGTESATSTEFGLVGAASDFTNEGISPAGVVSPFGTAATCSSAN